MDAQGTNCSRSMTSEQCLLTEKSRQWQAKSLSKLPSLEGIVGLDLEVIVLFCAVQGICKKSSAAPGNACSV